MRWVGLDIGGANIKVCLAESNLFSLEFPLWQQQHALASQLGEILQDVPLDTGIAVTMTGELADCFASRADGVEFIVESVVSQSGGRKTVFYTTDGHWLGPTEAKRNWLKVAAGNWHAIASYAARFLPEASGFLIDIGSTTTDIIPIRAGRPCGKGVTDLSRLASGELCYAGVERTPICSLLEHLELNGQRIGVARELFATIKDAFILLGNVDEDPENRQTADGRPAEFKFAAQRFAKMVCTDADLLASESLAAAAEQAVSSLENTIAQSLQTSCQGKPGLAIRFCCFRPRRMVCEENPARCF